MDSLPSEPPGKTGKFSLRASAIKGGKTWWQFQIQPPQLSTCLLSRSLLSTQLFSFNDPPLLLLFFLILFCCLKLIIIARQSGPLFEKLHWVMCPSLYPPGENYYSSTSQSRDYVQTPHRKPKPKPRYFYCLFCCRMVIFTWKWVFPLSCNLYCLLFLFGLLWSCWRKKFTRIWRKEDSGLQAGGVSGSHLLLCLLSPLTPLCLPGLSYLLISAFLPLSAGLKYVNIITDLL